MVIVKIMGAMDFLSAIALILLHYNVIHFQLGIIFACYLIFKGIIFMGDFASIVDLLCGVYMVLMLFHIHFFMTWVFFVWEMQKVVFSWLG